ncbi:hypothetical protein [Arthrobacter sp. NA-172]|uniref:hypothetical protein n=1 Tax=Arthrobacter sp. NA-172 TaxID=3367524 RepID=UPI0037549C69
MTTFYETKTRIFRSFTPERNFWGIFLIPVALLVKWIFDFVLFRMAGEDQLFLILNFFGFTSQFLASALFAMWAFQCRKANKHVFLKVTELARLSLIIVVTWYTIGIFMKSGDPVLSSYLSNFLNEKLVPLVGFATLLTALGPGWSASAEAKNRLSQGLASAL